MVSVKKYLSFLITCICLLHRSLPVTSVKGIARNCPFQHQNCFQFQSIHPGITWALILLALFHLRPPREIATFLPYVIISQKWVEAVALPTKEASGIASSLFKVCDVNYIFILYIHIIYSYYIFILYIHIIIIFILYIHIIYSFYIFIFPILVYLLDIYEDGATCCDHYRPRE